ncbi:DUF1287 domain-containing protein [Mesorhizobium sp. CU2]|uniref:DUF1287 domain-containing protein n=1 Tax=unclassified Mesorhizobium TaxID=325217 RepID=UPI00112D5462|nr:MULTISPECIES: DUF1287 domain-containing protein [unclassified Mesorhizobium]TPN88250.1 DUF1287 domain-containing protein [Mesorhizobium sp. CU3]TPO03554.1 DUF1287 domain-containing protein [Mesorhizobium sp. CU2]
MTPITRRAALQLGLLSLAMPSAMAAKRSAMVDWPTRLVDAARRQIGVTTIYDPTYTRIAYPGGDVAQDRGVCTDVVVRAYRKAFRLDLQKLVHEDMTADFAAYPKAWGLKATDTNIDHRRVPNLAMFFARRGASLPVSQDAADYQPGDLVTQMLPGNLTHIAIVSSNRSADAPERPLVIHNIGGGAREEDTLYVFRHTGHFRFAPT